MSKEGCWKSLFVRKSRRDLMYPLGIKSLYCTQTFYTEADAQQCELLRAPHSSVATYYMKENASRVVITIRRCNIAAGEGTW